MSDYVIDVKNVDKVYKLYEKPSDRMKEALGLAKCKHTDHKALSDVSMEIRKGEPIKSGSNNIGNRAKVKIIKNKVAPPFRTCTVDMIFGEGISRAGSLLDIAVERDFIKKSGSWFSYNGDRIGQGRDAAVQYLKDNPDVFDELDEKIREAMSEGLITAPLDSDEEEDDEPVDEE